MLDLYNGYLTYHTRVTHVQALHKVGDMGNVVGVMFPNVRCYSVTVLLRDRAGGLRPAQAGRALAGHA